VGRFAAIIAVMVAGLALPSVVAAAEPPVIQISIKDHRFSPTEVVVPAGVKVKLMVHNADATPEEFESTELYREKIVPAGSTVPVFVGPLSPGRYEFFGDFNPKTARGHLVVK
jgi:hypothetical protein